MSHRRTRGVRDGLEHSVCNILLFCRTCHVWLHTNPSAAIESGWAVSRYVEDPASVPARRWDGALVHLTKDGRVIMAPVGTGGPVDAVTPLDHPSLRPVPPTGHGEDALPAVYGLGEGPVDPSVES